MKIVVIGYSKMFASVINGVIESGHKVVGVLRHDRIKYNPFILFFKDIFNASNDYNLIKSKNLNEIKVESVNSEKFKKKLLKLNPDIVFVCSWSEKFQKEIFSLPKIATINIHPSLLPKYRGPNPYARVLFNDEEKTGVTFHIVDEKFDRGPILMQKEVKILDSDDGLSLKNKCASLARDMVAELLAELDNGMIIPTNQDENQASYYPALTASDAIINFSKSSRWIEKRIKGLYPWAKAYLDCNGVFLEARKYIIEENITEATPRTVVKKNGRSISVATVDNKIITFFDLKIVKTLLSPSTRLFIKFCLGDKI